MAFPFLLFRPSFVLCFVVVFALLFNICCADSSNRTTSDPAQKNDSGGDFLGPSKMMSNNISINVEPLRDDSDEPPRPKSSKSNNQKKKRSPIDPGNTRTTTPAGEAKSGISIVLIAEILGLLILLLINVILLVLIRRRRQQQTSAVYVVNYGRKQRAKSKQKPATEPILVSYRSFK